jgi:hypothetical protein
MAITLIGSNLNNYGNAGQFETDRSTWGFSDTSDFEFTRNNAEFTFGLFGAQTKAKTTQAGLLASVKSGTAFGVLTNTKTYIAKAKVKVSNASPIAPDAAVISLYAPADLVTLISKVDTTVADCKGVWTDIELRFSPSGGFITWAFQSVQINSAGLIMNGLLYVDQFEIYEYIETDEEDPEDPDPPADPEGNPYEIDNIYHSKNPIVISKTAPGGWALLDNFRMSCDVQTELSPYDGTFESTLKVNLVPDSDDTVYFYLGEAFRDAFTFAVPTANYSEIIKLTDRLRRFKCFFGSVTGDETEPETPVEDSIHLVIWGGIAKEKWPSLDYFTAYLPTNKKFLTWAPLQKYVDRQQEDYLTFWIYNSDIASIQLQAKIYYDDGTDTTQVIKSYEDVKYTELFQIPAGPANTGILLVDPEKIVVRYELSLLDQDDVLISEVRTYHIAQYRHPLTRYFMFINSLGGIEVLRFTGQAVSKTNYSRDTVQRFLPFDYDVNQGEFATTDSQMEKVTSYNSGYIKDILAKEWHEYMQDFLLAKPMPIYDVTDGDRIPLTVTSSIFEQEDQRYAFFIQFEAKPAYNNNSYTPGQI